MIEKVKILIGLVLLAGRVLAQGGDALTADAIIDKSIEFCGGEGRIKNIKTASVNYLLALGDESTAVVSEKVRSGEKYVQSVLSKSHVPKTTFFDGKEVTVIVGSTFAPVLKVPHKGEMNLKLFSQIQYGYKALGYKLKRLADQKFQAFDCYVVEATAPGGYTATNFFDKTNYRLLMIAYPDGNKSLMVEYVFKDDVLFNSRILNTNPGTDQVQELILQDVTLNAEIADVWFNFPASGRAMPASIQTGTFESIGGVKTSFIRTKETQDYYDENGKLVMKRNLKWMSDDTFLLTDQNGDKSPESEILVRIISWDETGYVCHWIAGKYFDTNHYRIKK